MSLCINPQCKNPHNSETTIFCQGCGSELLLDGRYRVVQELGQGGFGTTYEIVDLNNRPWVFKVLMDNHPKYVELFVQEAQVLRLLKHHGIPKIDLDGYFQYFPAGREEPLHCLVMEKIEGLDLTQYLQQRGNRPIKPKRALRWLAELALILEQVHAQNFFHRDIKPSNIMLRANGCLALIDFGTVRELTDSYLQKKAAGEVTGVVSQGYTPMEQIRGKAVLQSDFYALGGTMIYLLTTKNPGEFYNYREDRIIWRQAVPQIAPEFADLIDRMMEFSPANRPVDSREIFNRIIAIAPSLQILDEHYNLNQCNSSFETIAETKLETTIETNIGSNISASNTVFSARFNAPLTPEFLERCQKQLAEYIGPMASMICKWTVQQNPDMTESELSLALAQAIANPQQASEFQQKLIK